MIARRNLPAKIGRSTMPKKSSHVILLLVCALIGFAPELFGSSTLPVKPTNPDEKQVHLENIVDYAERNTTSRKKNLELIPVRFRGGSEDAYNAAEVERVIDSGKQDLLKALDDEDLQGLRSYVEVYYPAADLSFLRGDGDQLLATKSSTDAIAEKISAFLHKLRSIERLALRLKLVSLPNEAQFDLWPVGNEKARIPAVANQELQVYRGLYKYRVYKPGFKPSEYMLNLVDQTGSILECRLYKGEESDGPYPCLLK